LTFRNRIGRSVGYNFGFIIQYSLRERRSRALFSINILSAKNSGFADLYSSTQLLGVSRVCCIELSDVSVSVCNVVDYRFIGQWYRIQESRAAARKPRDAASVLFG